MTNEQARLEVIKAAYVPKHATEEEFAEMLPFIDTKTGWFHCIEYSRATGKTAKWYKEFLPYELRHLSDNNGWIRIEPDGSNLPEVGRHKVCNIERLNLLPESELMLAQTFSSDSVGDLFEKKIITHYKPITEEPKPIY
ncbi:hypothetical protein [Pedobacter faecalis]|uniref:hypothetical protein n=1 Tax=Pedobacter faecalis TaxID=3041495 RepID=UPI002549EBB3|nr:hypothetical protein [Pedobacter sp. ELA7]